MVAEKKVESADATTTATTSVTMGGEVDVTVHPLVLLSVADHYHRVAKGTRKRTVGVLLGTVYKGKVDATNSFAVPFEEDSRNPAVFYLDHNYLENMMVMFKKVNAKERIVGFYSTGPQIRSNDLRIYAIVKRFAPAGAVTPPVFVIIDVRPDRQSIPATAYRVIEEVDNNSNMQVKTFAHVPSVIGAMEVEEVGVEHLLRDINDPTVSTVASLIKAKMLGLASLTEKLVEIKDYLEGVADGRITKVNQEIIANIQTIVNLLPNLNIEELVQSVFTKTNDMHMVIYLSSLIRSVIALHDLINNKIKYMADIGKDHNDDDLFFTEEKKVDDDSNNAKKGNDGNTGDTATKEVKESANNV